MTKRRRWRVRLAAAAETDFRAIVRWTAERFGEAQARLYASTLIDAVAALAEGPDIAGARARADIGKGLMALHVARAGRKGRHFVIYRVGRAARREDPPTIDVLRVLHDSMDIPRHVDPADKSGD